MKRLQFLCHILLPCTCTVWWLIRRGPLTGLESIVSGRTKSRLYPEHVYNPRRTDLLGGLHRVQTMLRQPNAGLLILWTPAGGGITGWWLRSSWGCPGRVRVMWDPGSQPPAANVVPLQQNATHKRCTTERVPKPSSEIASQRHKHEAVNQRLWLTF